VVEQLYSAFELLADSGLFTRIRELEQGHTDPLYRPLPRKPYHRAKRLTSLCRVIRKNSGMLMARQGHN